ncbi:MAG: hypothetical protein LBV47_04515 [Bacteroidales bacterium]|jgi:hypothetical protein|nr:hypothetical protein [Bacteroidales bacterium]
MSRLRDFYRQNIYGVMGTLVFHILLVMSFLLSEIDIKGNVSEKELTIELTDMLFQEPEPIEEERAEPSEETTSQVSSNINETTNIASNRLAEPSDFFDQEYLNEIETAKQLVSNVNNQLSQKIIDISGIEMPVDNTEGINPDSIKNVINTGKSNIVYYLENRYHISLPIPVYLAQSGGNVIVDISVNRNGKVVKATVRKNSLIRSEQVYLYAEAAALRTVFNTSSAAPEIQTGTIHYTFIAQ